MSDSTATREASRRFRIVLEASVFSVAVLAVAFVAPVLGGSPQSPGPGIILWATAPLLISVIVRLAFRDRSNLGMSPRFRENVGWYAFSIVALPVVMCVSAVVGAQLSVLRVTAFQPARYLDSVLQAIPFFLLFAVFEELGWRGFLGPKLGELPINPILGYLLTSLIWASWHLPFIRELTWVYSPEPLETFIPRFYLSMFLLAVLYGELRALTGSVWPAVLIHASANAFGHPLVAGYITVEGHRMLIGSVSDGVITLGLVTLLCVVLHRARRRAVPRERSD